jgi:hydrogenase 3 maturation protease
VTTSLKRTLSQWLRDAQRIAVLGIGSDLRADDGAGVLVAEALRKRKSRTCKVFIGGTAPENLTGEIRKFQPTHLIIVDALEAGLAKGAVRVIDPKTVGGFSSSTHKMPMKVFTDYVSRSIGCEVIIVGIQPVTLEFNAPLSPEVLKAVKRVSDAIAGVLADRISIKK